MTAPEAPGEVLRVRGGGQLQGEVRVPGDKSISHRALLLAALADGQSTIVGLSEGDDVRRTAAAIVALGATVEHEGPVVSVRGGRHRLAAPPAPIDLGNSGTGMRLLAGMVSGLPGTTRLTGDESLATRPMDRVAQPLSAMGARVSGQGDRCLPPIEITGGHLHGIDYTPPMASAQVKSAILLAGLDADGVTVVREPVPTRAHTEEMLAAAGADVTVGDEAGLRVVRLRRSELRPGHTVVPGDPSQAAFWVVGAVIVPGSEVTVPDVHLGPERTGFVDVLRRMGASIDVVAVPGASTGTLFCRTSRLAGTTVQAAEIPSLDEVPILAVAAAVAEGETRFCDVGELRVKESDRLSSVVAMLAAMGASARAEGDDLVVRGSAAFAHGQFDSGGDHRMAMAAAIAAVASEDRSGHTTITGWGSVATSYPGFAAHLAALTGRPGGGPGGGGTDGPGRRPDETIAERWPGEG